MCVNGCVERNRQLYTTIHLISTKKIVLQLWWPMSNFLYLFFYEHSLFEALSQQTWSTNKMNKTFLQMLCLGLPVIQTKRLKEWKSINSDMELLCSMVTVHFPSKSLYYLVIAASFSCLRRTVYRLTKMYTL